MPELSVNEALLCAASASVVFSLPVKKFSPQQASFPHAVLISAGFPEGKG